MQIYLIDRVAGIVLSHDLKITVGICAEWSPICQQRVNFKMLCPGVLWNPFLFLILRSDSWVFLMYSLYLYT